MERNTGRCGKIIHLILLVCVALSGCAPALNVAPILPAENPTISVAETATPEVRVQKTLAQARPVSPTDRPPTPTPPPVTFVAEPAGCLSRVEQARMTSEDMLAYADRLLNLATPLSRRELGRVWNARAQATLATGSGVMAFSVADVFEQYQIQTILNALHVAGFVTWLRNDAHTQAGLYILALPLIEGQGAAPAEWEEYLRAYWQGSRSVPADDPTVIPTMKLAPCDWMVEAGFAPRVQPGALENADWAQPNLALAAQGYLAATTADAFAMAYRINWLENGDVESPVSMCGPLTWAILNDAGAFPPGYGGWVGSSKSFWLPKPSVNGRPWSLFPADTYTVRHFTQALGSFDFREFPLQAGDMLYTYTAGNGFEHVFVVTEVDGSKVYTVTNIIKNKPKRDFSVQRVLLYDLEDASAGIMRNEWANDPLNGRTGDKGFEVFRWNWRWKDFNGQAWRYTVQPGDSFPLVAARWRTPPEQIAAENQLDLTVPLKVGQALVIPPN